MSGCCDGAGQKPEQLIETLRMRLIGVGEAAVTLELANTIRDVCNDTNIWRDDIVFQTEAGRTRYELTPNYPRTEVVQMMGCLFDDRPLAARAGNYSVPGIASHYWSGFEPQVMNFPSDMVKKPTEVKIHVSVRPCDGGLEIPPAMAQDYFDILLAGAMARLQAHRDRPYADREDAERNRRIYEGGKNGMRNIAQKHNSMYGRTWGFPRFARGSGSGPRRGYYGYGSF